MMYEPACGKTGVKYAFAPTSTDASIMASRAPLGGQVRARVQHTFQHAQDYE